MKDKVALLPINTHPDEMGVEVLLAHLIDEAAGKLNGIAEQLRRKPYSAIEAQLAAVYRELAELSNAGQWVKAHRPDLAFQAIEEMSMRIE